MPLSWWCSAQAGAWSWTWKPYLGVWALVAVLVTSYLILTKRGRRFGEPSDRRRLYLYLGGVTVFWLAADWPLAAIGAGYLLSAHTLQYMLFVFAVPPLIIAGLPPWLMRAGLRLPLVEPLARFFSRPLQAFLTFNFVLLASHMPDVVDGLTVTQFGSFAVNMAWIFSGFVFWWQIIGPLPELEPMPYPGRLLFLLANIIVPTVPASFLTFAQYPVYSLYELAPPLGGLTPVEDQRIAALIMKVLGGLIIIGIGGVLFFRWSRIEGVDDESGDLTLPT